MDFWSTYFLLDMGFFFHRDMDFPSIVEPSILHICCQALFHSSYVCMLGTLLVAAIFVPVFIYILRLNFDKRISMQLFGFQNVTLWSGCDNITTL